MKRRCVWSASLVLVALIGLSMAAGPAVAGPKGPPKFVGDSGQSHGAAKAAGMSIVAVSANTTKNLDRAKSVSQLTFFDGQTFVLKGKKLTLLSPQDFLDFLKTLTDKQSMRGPPKNNVLVVDSQKWMSLTPTQRDALTVWRTVTKTRTYLATVPVFEARMTVCYPCCCHRMVNFQTGTKVVPKTDTVTVQEPAGANYPTKMIAVDRDLYMKNGTPYYRTELPQFLDGSDGKPYPMAPISTDQNDNLVPSGGGTTKTNEKLGSSSQTIAVDNVQVGTYHGLVLTGTGSATETDTYVGTVESRPALATKQPLADPAVGLATGRVSASGIDAGVNTFSGDVTDVVGGMSVGGEGTASKTHRSKK